MPEPKRISEQVVRDLMVESGHRCAVCGDAFPLERAHIVPLQKGGKTTFENLICLCSNCHARADAEAWGEKILKTYKAKPWSSHRHDPQSTNETNKAQIAITINAEHVDLETLKQLEAAISAFLKIAPDSVRIVSTKKG